MFVVLIEVLTEETCRGGDELSCTVRVFYICMYMCMFG